jgi:adenylate cyclase
VEETEKEKTQLNDGGLRTPDLQDPSSNSPVSSTQSLIPNTQPPAPIRSWSSRSFVLAGVLLLGGIIVTVQYLSQPSLSTQNLVLVTKEAQPPSLPLPDKPSIIVLPFVNLSGDPAQEYFSDGITEEITARLSQVSSLFVIARTSAFTYKGKGVKVQDISREMGVRYVLEGSVRKTDDQLRIIAQLIDATSGEHLWAEHYDRPLKDIFAVQDEIVQKIVTTLNLQLTLWEQGVLVRKRTNSLEAYDFYLRGVESMWRAAYEGKKELNAQAEQMFEKAIELDPQYAEAYAGLGSAKYNDWFYVWDSTQALEEAFQAEKTAIALDDSLPLAHSILGQVYLWRKQHEQAVNEARRAVALAPNDASSYAHLGNILTFAGGELNQAISLIERGMRLNPRYPPVYLVALAITYRVAGRCEEALAPLQRAAALAPNFIQARVNLAVCYVEVDRLPEAQAEVAEIRRINPGFSLAWMTQRLPFKDQAVIERMVAALRKAGLK